MKKVDEIMMPFHLNDKGNIELEFKIDGKQYIAEITPKDVKHMEFIFEVESQ